jgi:hypothetical protein
LWCETGLALIEDMKTWRVYPSMAVRLVAAILFSGCLGAHAVELHLTYEQTEETETVMQPAAEALGAAKPDGATEAKGGKAEPKHERKTAQIVFVIGERYLVVRQNGSALEYDFDAKRVLGREKADLPWTGSSLFSVIGFQVAEYQNRVMLGGLLSSVGLKDQEMLRGMGDTFELETLFGLRMPDERSKQVEGLTRMEGKGKRKSWMYTHGGAEVVFFEPSTHMVPAELRDVYTRWFVYCMHLHPEIRRQIVEVGMVPARLRTNWCNTGMKGRTEVVLKSAEVRKGNSEAPASVLAVADGASGMLHEVLAASRDPKRWEQRATKESVAKAADEAIADGRALDGVLTLMEFYLQSGVNVTTELARHRQAIGADARCKQFFAAMQQGDKAACERSVEALRVMDRQGLTKAHVLDIHLANALTSLGKTDDAEKLFFSVLQANPLIAGVWHDLGQLYHGGYEMPMAWLCWDNARRLYPEHPMLAGITNLERRLEQDFPEFFLPVVAASAPTRPE